MNNTLFIPEKCKVGFNEREDCFSRKLGYVIGLDGKKWRKERSWEGWIKRPGDEKGYGSWVNGVYVRSQEKYGDDMEPVEFDNVPTEGFVLNKKVGGHSSGGWNARQTYSRIFDPRGFEIEISVQNLLYILENCNSIKGKALEGEFVYSWDGKDLVLLPVNAPEYQASKNFKRNTQTVKTKDLFEGHVYFDKDDTHYIYLGKRNWYRFDGETRKAIKCHIFYCEADYRKFKPTNSLGFLKGKISDTISSDYANIIQKFQKLTESAEITDLKLVPVELDYNGSYYEKVFLTTNDLSEYASWYKLKHSWRDNYQVYKTGSINLKTFQVTTANDGYLSKNYNKEQLKQIKPYSLEVIYSNGEKKLVNSITEI